MMIAHTPEPPYYAVIFSSLQSDNTQSYQAMAEKMVELATRQAGFLGVESAREGLGITVSYWRDEASIIAWKADVEHQAAQKLGRERWYAHYKTRVCRVERDYEFRAD